MQVRPQRLGHGDGAVRILMVFQNRGHGQADEQSATVQRVA